MRIFLSLIFLFSLSFAYDIEQIYYNTPVVKAIDELHQIQSEAFDKDILNDDEAMQKLLDKNAKLLTNILLNIKAHPYSDSFLKEDAFKKRIRFLKNRMKLNQKRGNHYAVERDKIDLARLKQFRYFNDYILGISKKVQEYASQKEIKDYALSILKEHSSHEKDDFSKLYQSISKDNNPVANRIKETYRDYISLYETYNRLLEFTVAHPQLLSQKTIFTLINYADIIHGVNTSPYAQQLNNSISFLYLNSGKLVTFVMIIVLFFMGSIFSKGVLRLSFLNFKHYQNRKLLRPIRVLLTVTAFNYFLLTWMYPITPSEFLSSFITLVNISSLAYLTMELIAYFIVGYAVTKSSSQNEKALISLSIDVFKVLIAVAAFVVFLNKMGVSLQTVLTTLGIFGLGIALAAKDSLANFFGSLNILLDDTFSQGDVVSIQDLQGEIVKVGLRSTQIRGFDNSLIILPNAEVAIKPIINWSRRRLGKEIKTEIAISYKTPPQKIKDLIDEIRYMISQNPDLVQNDDIEKYENEPGTDMFVSRKHLLGLKKDRFVYLHQFDKNHLSILVQSFSRTTDREQWYQVKENLLYELLEILQKSEIEFAMPEQKIHLLQT